MNRRGTSAELEGVSSEVVMDPWHDFDIQAGPDSQYLMRGASPSKDGMTPEGDVVMGDEVGARNPFLDGQWRRGVGMGRIPGYRCERRGDSQNGEFRYVRETPQQRQQRRRPKRRRPGRPSTTSMALQLAAQLAAQQARSQQGEPEPAEEEWEEWGESQDSPPPLGGDGIAQSFAAEGILGDASPMIAPAPTPFSYGASSALHGYQRPSPPPPQGYPMQPAPQGYPQTAPQGYPPAPSPWGGGASAMVKGEPNARPRLAHTETNEGRARRHNEAGYWTSLTSLGTPIPTGEWTEIGTLGEAIERIRAVARDFRALPVLGTGATGTAGTNEFRALVYQGITSGRYNRQRGWDLVRQYGEKWGRALSALVFIDEVDDDERLINEAANEVRDRVNDCRNLVRAATSR